jgi:hypothetical protein
MQRETRKQYIPVVSGVPETAGFCLWGMFIFPAPVILNDSEGSSLFVMPTNERKQNPLSSRDCPQMNADEHG